MPHLILSSRPRLAQGNVQTPAALFRQQQDTTPREVAVLDLLDIPRLPVDI